MNTPNDPLSPLFAELRAAEAGRDFTRAGFALETRVLARIACEGERGLGAPWRLRLLWKFIVGAAAVVGFLFFWMSNSGALDLNGEEPLWALWGGADSTLKLFPN